MKAKKLFLISAVGLVAAAAFVVSQAINSQPVLSDAVLENIEAISSTEGGGRCTGRKTEMGVCLCKNSHPCSDNYGCKS